MCEDSMEVFASTYNFKNLVSTATCFKNIDHPSCIDLILTNKTRSFQNTTVIETSLSDFHKLTVTIMKANFQKHPPEIVNYRKYKNFNNEMFRNDLLQELRKVDFPSVECCDFEGKRNLCVTLLKETKKIFYENLNPILIRDNKKFRQVKPFFSDKTPTE